jgi:glycogen phosphorylase
VQESATVNSQFDVPSRIHRLVDIAYNMWWSWNPTAIRLWESIDPRFWQASLHNPIVVLKTIPARRLETLARDATFLRHYDGVVEAFDRYMNPADKPWYARTFAGDGFLIAYFCAEYGIHESIPIYSGGLGVLAGDHCKTTSDLGLPLIAIGLWYTQGFFTQTIDASGQQVVLPGGIRQIDAPLTFAGHDGEDVVVQVPMAARIVFVRVWRLQVGRMRVYLLDPDVTENSDADRQICMRLYGGGRETRIAQEVILGVGGVRALRALDIKPTTYHMNEGHAGFMGLERIANMVEAGIPFAKAWPLEAESTIFTTHTPVPAGNEVFHHRQVLAFVPELPARMGLDDAGFLALGKEEGAAPEMFAMTPLALRLSHHANGVSSLHGAVARRMWSKQFPSVAEEAVPITSITNGVHSPTWLAPDLAALFDRYLDPDWLDRVDDPQTWDRLSTVPDEELWAAHLELKRSLVARAYLLENTRPRLNPDVLTIGFARRFATYKRATLFFHDAERALRILSNPTMPVQLVYAGKAHPADGGGQALIKQIVEIAGDEKFAGHVAILPGYDMSIAASLVQGVDIWLNNPERPLEASGTSGQKAAINGVPNCSIRDGWWDEGFNGTNGWAFGGPVGDDNVDSSQLYDVLEQTIIPSFYSRGADNVPRDWVATMKESIRSLAPAFSSQRMLKEYTLRLYREAR